MFTNLKFYKKYIVIILLAIMMFGFIIIVNSTNILSNNNQDVKNNIEIENENLTTQEKFLSTRFATSKLFVPSEQTGFYTNNSGYASFYFSESGSIYGLGNGLTLGIGSTGIPNNPLLLNPYWEPYFDVSEIKYFYLSGFTVYTFLNNGEIFVWGSNSYANAGLGHNENLLVPTRVDHVWNTYFDTSKIIDFQISMGSTMVFLDNGEVWGWGENVWGDLGQSYLDYEPDYTLTPVLLNLHWNKFFDSSLIDKLYLYQNTTYVFLSNGQIWGWGNNSAGELGIGTRTGNVDGIMVHWDPIRLDLEWNKYFDTTRITNLYINSSSIYVFLDNGEIWGWGKNEYGQLGIGNNNPHFVLSPIRLDLEWNKYFDTSKIEKFYISFASVYTFLDNGEIWAWGTNYAGELGIGTKGPNVDVLSPLRVDIIWDETFDTSLIHSFNFSTQSIYVILTDGSIYVWGENRSKALGLSGIMTDQPNPVLALKFSGFDYEYNGNFIFRFSFDKAYWGYYEREIYYTIYLFDINAPLVPSTKIENLNIDGKETIVETSFNSFPSFRIRLTSRPNSEGIVYLDEQIYFNTIIED